MTTYRRPDDGVETYQQPADQTQVHPLPPASEPAYAEPEAGVPDEEYREDRQRRHYGGVNWGAGFLGWLVTVAVAVLLSGIAGVAIAALGATGDMLATEAAADPDAAGVVAAAFAAGVLLVSYYTGGYVAGRMSRFDGSKQGFAVWVTGLLLAGVAVGGWLLFGTPASEVLDRLNPTTLPVPTWAGGIGGPILAVAGLLGTLLAAMTGGKVGCRYHRKVDDAAYL